MSQDSEELERARKPMMANISSSFADENKIDFYPSRNSLASSQNMFRHSRITNNQELSPIGNSTTSNFESLYGNLSGRARSRLNELHRSNTKSPLNEIKE